MKKVYVFKKTSLKTVVKRGVKSGPHPTHPGQPVGEPELVIEKAGGRTRSYRNMAAAEPGRMADMESHFGYPDCQTPLMHYFSF